MTQNFSPYEATVADMKVEHGQPATLESVPFNPSSMSRVVVRATNWLGDAVMSLPAIRAIRGVFPDAHLAVVARPWVADLYARERCIDQIVPYPAKTFAEKREFARRLRSARYDAAILLPNSFDSALTMWMAGIPERIGYKRDARGMLLTRAIPVPEPGDIPRHERFYYLELLRRAGMLERFPNTEPIELDGIAAAREAGASKLAALGIAPARDRHQSRRRVWKRQALAAGAIRGGGRARGARTGRLGAGVRRRRRARAMPASYGSDSRCA